ncbi:isochorismatase family protein [Sandaracinobacteroides saxicola]|uniref:Isochorismatase family protein n=1 Tax=Sandaracinobacteroides saxicola TaxID=2759707 RepID=A0A7G5IE04_9SPHN|nr:isochorismatase family protein [Sandaracinobacteroides saxicola]QMW21596.1 isochorismatase family protein [Sandaracinobacteroides saxicola]
METTPFEPKDTALLLIDHQVGTMGLIRTMDRAHSLRMAIALAKTARVLDMPIVLTTSQEDHTQGPLATELAALLPDEYAVRIKRQGIADAWRDANFKAAVEATGKRNLVMAAVTTDVCLVFPAISAVADGYRVQGVLDASGSPYDVSEEMARRRMAAAGVVLTATNTLIAELVQDWSTAAGQQLIGLLFSDVLPPIEGAGHG